MSTSAMAKYTRCRWLIRSIQMSMAIDKTPSRTTAAGIQALAHVAARLAASTTLRRLTGLSTRDPVRSLS
jgi:hypothetical protein